MCQLRLLLYVLITITTFGTCDMTWIGFTDADVRHQVSDVSHT